jgi:hypothetical protein
MVAEGQGEVTGSTGTGTSTATVVTASPTNSKPESSGPPKAPSGERTHPRLQPTTGRRHTRFTLTFTLRDTPGHQGVLAVDYHVQVAPPVGARASCTPAEPPTIDAGTAGAIEQVPLTPPAQGWCRVIYPRSDGVRFLESFGAKEDSDAPQVVEDRSRVRARADRDCATGQVSRRHGYSCSRPLVRPDNPAL